MYKELHMPSLEQILLGTMEKNISEFTASIALHAHIEGPYILKYQPLSKKQYMVMS